MVGLSLGLFGKARALSEFPRGSGLTGLGLTDWTGYSRRLRRIFDYQNTFLDHRPKLDICQIPGSTTKVDFVIALDVIEHVPPPVESALSNLASLIKDEGVAIVSVPYSLAEETIEHFPNLNVYTILDVFGSPCLINKRLDGRLEIFSDLIFHGGPGRALEMRLFGRGHLIETLQKIGLCDLQFVSRAPEWGIIYENECSHVVVARKRAGWKDVEQRE